MRRVLSPGPRIFENLCKSTRLPAPRMSRRVKTWSGLSAANELDNLDLRAVAQFRRGPVGLLDDAPVQFDGHALRVDFERDEQIKYRLAFTRGMRFAV